MDTVAGRPCSDCSRLDGRLRWATRQIANSADAGIALCDTHAGIEWRRWGTELVPLPEPTTVVEVR